MRYNQYVKTEINLVNKTKVHSKKENVIHNMIGGRWFVCENQHSYYVGDRDSATKVSRCPECEAPIGGTQHKVAEFNRFYREFDGSENPAWPG